jgi:hypothetical protein
MEAVEARIEEDRYRIWVDPQLVSDAADLVTEVKRLTALLGNHENLYRSTLDERTFLRQDRARWRTVACGVAFDAGRDVQTFLNAGLSLASNWVNSSRERSELAVELVRVKAEAATLWGHHHEFGCKGTHTRNPWKCAYGAENPYAVKERP